MGVAGVASVLDFEGLLQPVGAGAPSGPDLKYSAEYSDLQRAVEGKPERQVGSTITPGEPPDWASVFQKSIALFKASKDLRIAVVLVRALLETGGFAGFSDGLALVRRLVEQHWATFHPQLDADDGNDPTARISAMAELTHRNMMQSLRAAPLASAKTFGIVTLRALDAAASPAKAAAAKPAPPANAAAAAPAAPAAPTLATLEAAFAQVPTEVLGHTAAAVARGVEETRLLSAQWNERLPGAGPDFGELQKLLGQAAQALKARLDPRKTREAPVAVGAGSAPSEINGAAALAAAAPAALRTEVLSREDVLRSLDAICAYYASHEPSSPVPLLLQRCKRLVTMSFMDILKEIVPESVPNVQKITGKDA